MELPCDRGISTTLRPARGVHTEATQEHGVPRLALMREPPSGDRSRRGARCERSWGLHGDSSMTAPAGRSLAQFSRSDEWSE